jgi:hypothetical protein
MSTLYSFRIANQNAPVLVVDLVAIPRGIDDVETEADAVLRNDCLSRERDA